MPESSLQALRDWWPFGAFLLSAAFAFVLGRERYRWRVDQIGREVERQGERINALEAQGQAEAVTLAEIKVTQGMILAAISELRDDIKQKADK